MKISKELQKARDYEAAHSDNREKAVFHICSPMGWINDPNGFSFYKDECHLFYQYYPYGAIWGPMHWGHSVTRDFISWEGRPAALAPDTEYDGQGCFSGSALEFKGNHVLMYTGVQEGKNEDGTHWTRQSQCIAQGDGTDYEKFAENPIISAELLPEGSSKEDFRDPKIWQEDGKFYAVVASRAADGSGQIPLFESEDLKNWKLVSILESCRNEYGAMWECPDFFPLNDKRVLIVSPQDMVADGLEFHCGNGTVAFIGTYDKEQKQFTRESVQSVDYGLDFYAAQTTQTADGRRIMIGWMQSWDNHIRTVVQNWSGRMTVPRELTIQGGMLCQNPVRELENYRKNPVSCELAITGGDAPKSCPEINGRVIDITVEISECKHGTFTIEVAKNGSYHTDILYDADKQTVSFDRTYCGIRRDFIAYRAMPVSSSGGTLKLRILLDKDSVEIFVNDGEQAMTALICTPLCADAITFFSTADCKLRVTKYNIAL